MKKTFIFDAVAIFALIFANVALATGTATVSATVTLQNVSVVVTDGSVDYGTLPTDTVKTTLVGGVNDAQFAVNTGNVAEDFNIKGQNSENWTIASAAGVDEYVHAFCTGTCGTNGTPTYSTTTAGVGFTPLSDPINPGGGYETLEGNVSSSATSTFNLLIHTPTESTHFDAQSVDVVVQAVAH